MHSSLDTISNKPEIDEETKKSLEREAQGIAEMDEFIEGLVKGRNEAYNRYQANLAKAGLKKGRIETVWKVDKNGWKSARILSGHRRESGGSQATIVHHPIEARTSMDSGVEMGGSHLHTHHHHHHHIGGKVDASYLL